MLGALIPFLAAAISMPEVNAAYIRNMSPGADGASGSAVMVEIFVAPDRTVESCRVLVSDFSEQGNQRICEQARRRRASIPARDADGNPIHGFTTFSRIAVVGNGRPRVSPAFLEPAYMVIDVADLPGGDTRQSVYVMVLVDAEGMTTHCEGGHIGGPALSQVACQQLSSQTLPVMRDRAGSAVPYVKALKVDFVEQSLGS